ncbi:Protein chain release factor B [Caldanaerobacter subterraneus subsp. tengcongensis MB4]|uniref:Peptide chain release factor 2 n=1 Tax=Caldanaerobacter subterraneus subsp. tengcongensis (strain DSM 15242 / JCM 11007 / NBRC 100824 / MB4) TaxID=273068 RepID=Q8RCB3_CALS4|nr:Protein chain release factor B [Caldanaerobacter subterraneus subsp. tengcongensis MB4]
MFLFDVEGIKKEIEDIEKQMSDPSFWSDLKKSQELSKKQKALKELLEEYESLLSRCEDLYTLIELGLEEGDESIAEEVEREYKELKKEVENLKIRTLLSGPYDKNNAILSIHAGSGGTEAQDWAEMLLRMYTRWANDKGFEVEILDYLEGEEAGIKSATLLIKGPFAYGYLKGEAGVHRLVRISPFDAAGRRHTSFALVEVIPELEDDIEIEIRPEDLKIDTFRASGAGGQHVNKTESAVRITHLPTGIVVSCQNERSQIQNRETAMKMLKAKLLDLMMKERKEKIEDLKGEHREAAWGNQIRSYVFQPYTLVKDHRTNYEEGNVNAVMDGEIDGFINAYLKQKSAS